MAKAKRNARLLSGAATIALFVGLGAGGALGCAPITGSLDDDSSPSAATSSVSGSAAPTTAAPSSTAMTPSTPSSTTPPAPVTPQVRKTRFVQSITAASVRFADFDLALRDPAGRTYTVTAPDLAYDARPAAPFSLSGNVTFATEEMNETLGLFYDAGTGYLTIAYAGMPYRYTVANLPQALASLSALGLAVPAMDTGAFEALDPTLLSSALTLLLNQTAGADGSYTYTLDLGACGKMVFGSDGDDALSYIKTPLAIDVKNLVGLVDAAAAATVPDLHLALEATVATQTSAAGLTTAIDLSRGFSDLDAANGLLGSLALLFDRRAVGMDYTVALNETGRSQPLVLAGTMAVDAQGKDDLANGKYRLTLGDQTRPAAGAELAYEDRTAFIRIGDTLKGRLADTTLAGLADLFAAETGQDALGTGFDLGARVLSAPLFRAVLAVAGGGGNGQTWATIKDAFASGLTIDGSVARFGLKASALGLGSGVIDLAIDLGGPSAFPLQGIAIGNLPSAGGSVDLTLAALAPLASGLEPVDRTAYRDYDGVLPLFGNIAALVRTPRVLADFSVALQGAGESSAVSGTLGIDLADARGAAETTDFARGRYYVKAQTVSATATHNLEATFQDGNLYFALSDRIRRLLTAQTIGKLRSLAVSELGLDPSALGSVAQAIDSLAPTLAANLFPDGTLDLTWLSQLVKVEATPADTGLETVVLDPSLLGQATGLFRLTVDRGSGAIRALELTGLAVGSNTADLTLSFKDFAPFALTETQLAEYRDVGDLGALGTGIFDLLSATDGKYGVTLEASVADLTGGYAATVTGRARFDRGAGTYDGYLAIDPDANSYDVSLRFAYGDPAASGRLLVSYNDQLNIDMGSDRLDECVAAIAAMDNTNLLYKYIHTANQAAAIPLADLVAAGDVTGLLGDTLRAVSFDAGTVTVALNPAAVGLSGSADVDVTLAYGENGITGVGIANAEIDGRLVNVALERSSYDETAAAGLDFAARYIDFDYLPVFLAIGLDTTANRAFAISGRFNVTPKLFNVAKVSTIATTLDFRILVTPDPDIDRMDRVEAYIRIAASDTTYAEYCILPNGDTVMVRKSQAEKSVRLFKVTQQEMLKNIFWYVGGLGLDLEHNPLVFNQVNDNIGSIGTGADQGGLGGTSIRPEAIIKDCVYDPAARLFTMQTDLGSIAIAAGIKLADDVDIDIRYDEGHSLTELSIAKSKLITVGGFLVTVDLDLDLVRDPAAVVELNRYRQVLAYYGSQADALGYYEVTGFKSSGFLGLGRIVASDNGQLLTVAFDTL